MHGKAGLKQTVVALSAIAAIAFLALCRLSASAAPERPPQVPAADRGLTIDDVTVEAYGITKPDVAKRYLALHAGDVVTQAGVEHDYVNLATLAGLRTRLEIRHTAGTARVSLHWIVLEPVFEVTDHPFYGDQPLSIPIEGFGTVLTTPPLDSSGATLSTYTQVALRAQLVRLVYTKPTFVDPKHGREGDLIVNTLGARGVFRATEPIDRDVYSWLTGYEALYLIRATGGTQVEAGVRTTRATSAHPTYIVAPSLFDTFYAPARTTAIEAGVSHHCPVAPTRWYPPNCYLQYRIEGFDSIGGLGANAEYRSALIDVAQYTRVGSSTLVFHGAVNRTGGILPTSNLQCAYTFGYAKATCGTDADIVQGEFRIADARPGPLKFVLFTETAASRIRGGDQTFAPPNFQWRADSGAGIVYRGFRFNVAYGNQGGRITYEVQGQLF